MKLIFVRHGQATAYCADDAGRDLTDFGKQQAQETADFLANYATCTPIDVIITSPYHRAAQTANIILNTLINANQNPKLLTLDSITPDDNPSRGLDDIIDIIYHECGVDNDNLTIVIVCHMPIVARMVAILDGLSLCGFELAECRILQTYVIAPNLARQVAQFIPKQP